MARHGIILSIEAEGHAPLVFGPAGPIDQKYRSENEPTVIIQLSKQAVSNIVKGETFQACRKAGSIVIGGNYTHWGLLACLREFIAMKQAAEELLHNGDPKLGKYPRVDESLELIAHGTAIHSEKGQLTYSAIPGYKHTPWLNEKDIELTEMVKDYFPLIRNEAYQLLDGTLPSDKESKDSEWEIDAYPLMRWPLFRGGKILHDRCKHFPQTSEFLDKAIATGRLSSLCFLITHPGDSIPRHSDGNSIFCSWHAGIIVEDGSGIEVNRRVMHHKEDHCFTFDDGFDHWAWNKSTSPRVMLSA